MQEEAIKQKHWAWGGFLELIERRASLGLRSLDIELGEVELVDDFGTEKTVELGNQLFAKVGHLGKIMYFK